MTGRGSMPLRLAVLCTLTLPVVACSTTPYRLPLSEPARAEVGQPAVYTQLADTGVGIELLEQDSVAAGQAAGGLIGILVASAIDNARNAGPAAVAEGSAQRIAPRVDLGELRTLFETSVRERLQGVGPFQESVRTRSLQQYQQMDIASFSEQQTVLAIKVGYSLTPDLRNVHVAADVFLLSRAPVIGKAKAGIAYRNRLEYISNPIDLAGAQAGESSLVEKWLSDGAARLKAELAAGTEAIVALLVRDIVDPVAAELPSDLPPKTELETQGDRAIVRVNRGLYAGSLVSEPRGYTTPAFNRIVYPKAGGAAPVVD